MRPSNPLSLYEYLFGNRVYMQPGVEGKYQRSKVNFHTENSSSQYSYFAVLMNFKVVKMVKIGLQLVLTFKGKDFKIRGQGSGV